MGLFQSIRNAFRRIVGRPGPREPVGLEKAKSDQKAYREEMASLDKATRAFEHEQNPAVNRKAKVATASGVTAGRKEIDGLIDKADKVPSASRKPARASQKPSSKAARPKPKKS